MIFRFAKRELMQLILLPHTPYVTGHYGLGLSLYLPATRQVRWCRNPETSWDFSPIYRPLPLGVSWSCMKQAGIDTV
jgi:hypothetical protein